MLLVWLGSGSGGIRRNGRKKVESPASPAESSLRASGMEAVSHLERQTKTTSSIRHVYAEFDRDDKGAKCRQAWKRLPSAPVWRDTCKAQMKLRDDNDGRPQKKASSPAVMSQSAVSCRCRAAVDDGLLVRSNRIGRA